MMPDRLPCSRATVNLPGVSEHNYESIERYLAPLNRGVTDRRGLLDRHHGSGRRTRAGLARAGRPAVARAVDKFARRRGIDSRSVNTLEVISDYNPLE